VRWLDLHHRELSLAAAAVASCILLAQFCDTVGSDWPRFHVVGVAGSLLAVTWWLAEVGLAGITALWEAEAVRIGDRKGLPAARLVPRRRRLDAR
jgi:hypothetical protein